MKTHLFFGVLTLVLLIIVIGTCRREAFNFDDVVSLAQAMAAARSVSRAPALRSNICCAGSGTPRTSRLWVAAS
jgi:hypothetical protein